MAHDYLGCQRHDGDTGHLADIGNRTAGTGIYLDDVHILAAHDKLDIDQSDDMKGPGQPSLYSPRWWLCTLSLMLWCRIYGDTVSGMDTGALDMLHDTRDQDILSVADRVNLDLLSHAGTYLPESDAPGRSG